METIFGGIFSTLSLTMGYRDRLLTLGPVFGIFFVHIIEES
jgi:hypothetical protein